MEIQIKAYAYTIDIITEIRYFCKCNNAVFGKFRIIFTYTISKTNCSLHHNFHALFKISGNGKFVRTAVLPPRPSRNLSKSTPRPRTAPPHQPFQNRTIPFAFRRASVCVCLYGFVFALSLSLFVGEELVSRVTWFTLCASTWFTCYQ